MYLSEVHGKGSIYAKVVAASIANGIPIYTLELRYHRFIHSEFMTHRMFSRNASSSRAIPVERMIEQIKNGPAIPIYWGKDQKGMQAREELEPSKLYWIILSQKATDHAFELSSRGYHKQLVNRILEPFQFITVVVTATEWDNFFKLRLHPDAQPEIQELARCMKEAMELVVPTKLRPGEWHLPYVPKYDENGNPSYYEDPAEAIKCSVARCARVSYLNHDKSSPDIAKDLELADRLLKDGHLTPFEHQATPMKEWDAHGGYDQDEDCEYVESPNTWERGITHADRNEVFWSANFRGWVQNRQLI